MAKINDGTTWQSIPGIPTGGTANQALTKIDGTNYNVQWATVAGGGGTPATTVTSETTYGIASAVGTSTNYARQDHTHGSPTAPVIPNPATTVTTQAVGDAAVVGTATTYAREDHKHAREAFGSVTAQVNFSLASTDGTATTLSRSDHAHGTMANPLPTGGAAGQVLSKIDATSYNVQWSTAGSGNVPVGGVANAALLKNSATDYDLKWSPDTTTDWLPQYALIAGRAGTQIWTMSSNTAGGNTINGANAAGAGVIILNGDSTASGAGAVNLRSPVRLRDITNETLTSDPGPGIRLRQTHTINYASGQWGGGNLAGSTGIWSHEPILVFAQNAATFGSMAFTNRATVKNSSGVAVNLGILETFDSRPTYTADNAAVTLGPIADFYSGPLFTTVGTGTLTGGSDFVGFEATCAPGAGVTLPLWRGFVMKQPTNSGGGIITQGISFSSTAITSAQATNWTVLDLASAISTTGTNIYLDIGTASGGTTNIGIRNASTTVWTPTAATIATAAATVPITASTVNLNNTSGGALTLTSAPTMAAGQNGQTITLVNISAQPITLQDESVLTGSNIRNPGGANLTLNQRDSVVLTYSSSLTDWVVTTSSPARGEIAYASNTTAVGPITTTGIEIVGVNANVVAGRKYRIVASYRGLLSTIDGDVWDVYMLAGATNIRDSLFRSVGVSLFQGGATVAARYLAASTASVRFGLNVVRSSGTGSGTVAAGAAAGQQNEISVEDMGT